MRHIQSKKLKLFLALVIVFVVCIAIAFWPRKVNYTANEVVPFSDFTIQIVKSQEGQIKLGEMSDFYTAVWSRTAADLQDCSKKNNTYVMFTNEKEECERINGDINRDLATKAGIAKYLDENKRVDIAYKIKSNNDSLDIGNIKIILVSGEEDLSLKTFDYDFIYKNESKKRIANNINRGTLTKDLSRSGTMWADVKKQTNELVMKIDYYGQVKTIVLPTNFQK